MPPTQEPPAQPAAPAKPSAAELAAKTTINVSDLPQGSPPSKTPKAGTARAKMFDEMQKKFGGEQAQPPAKGVSQTPADKASPADQPKDAQNTEAGAADTPASTPKEEPPADGQPTAPTPTEGDKGKKTSPWKLFDQAKERAIKAEARIIELEKQVQPEEQRKAVEGEIEQLRTRVKEMSDDLRYYNAEKYDPDVLKAKENYQRAFGRAMSELKEVSIVDPATQQPRAMTVNDLAELAFMPLGQAQATAKEVFGDLAPYVMDHRNEIRRLWDTQQGTLEELKKNGSERDKQRMESMQKNHQQLSELVSKTYQQANEEAAKDPQAGHLFRPREDDGEWNTRLEKGFNLVDEAFKQNVFDPKLTNEQRLDVIRRHAAVRNRAAAFGPLRWEVESLKKRLEEANKELKQFKETTPTATGRTSAPAKEKLKGMAGMMEDLKKIAH